MSDQNKIDTEAKVSPEPVDVPVYCLSFNNPERKNRMISRMDKIGMGIEFIEPTLIDDPKIKEVAYDPRTWCVMTDHLKMLAAFVDTGKSHGIFCEDDIYIRTSMKEDLPDIIERFDKLNLDVLLLGYLSEFYPREVNHLFPLKEPYTYHNYHDELWGAQMYMVSRKHAQNLLEKYTIQYAIDHPEEPYNPDWTITKNGNRAIIYPMIAVEEGNVATTHQGQIDFHRRCTELHYDPTKYI